MSVKKVYHFSNRPLLNVGQEKKVKCEANKYTKTCSPRDPCTYCLKMMRVNAHRYTMNRDEMSSAFCALNGPLLIL